MKYKQEYRSLAVPPELHQRVRLLAARMDINIMDVVKRGIDLLEAQNELPHPAGATSVPVVYTQQEGQ